MARTYTPLATLSASVSVVAATRSPCNDYGPEGIAIPRADHEHARRRLSRIRSRIAEDWLRAELDMIERLLHLRD